MVKRTVVKRTKTGCISCRIRRIKCDETKPHCLRCKASKRTCDGYLPTDSIMSRQEIMDTVRGLGHVGPVSQAFTQAPPIHSPGGRPHAPNDYVHFDYFRRAIAPGTGSLLASDFWCEELLQLAHTEPAIWHATVAIGALHRNRELASFSPETSLETKSLEDIAAEHYGNAMILAKNLDSPLKLLSLALPLIAASNLLSLWSDSHTHILAGLRILASSEVRTPETECIASTLSRMDLQSMTFSDSSAPYPFIQAAGARSPELDQTLVEQPMKSYAHASSVLFILLRKTILLHESYAAAKISESQWLTGRDSIYRTLHSFECKMEKFEKHHPQYSTIPAAMSVRLYHCWLRMVLKAAIFGPEKRYDSFLGYFYRIFVLAKATIGRQTSVLHISLEPGLIVPLFYAAMQCRHPFLRRRILQLLKGLHRQEGMWRSDGAAAAMEVLLDIEEEGYSHELAPALSSPSSNDTDDKNENVILSLPWSAWANWRFEPPCPYDWDNVFVPSEARRVKEVLVFSRFEKREVDLKILMSPTDPSKPFGLIHDVTVGFQSATSYFRTYQ